MAVNPDFRDLFASFNAAEVRYLVVGAYAVTFHSRPRFTKDLDIWGEPRPDNAVRTYAALKAFGAPLADVTPEDFANEEQVFQIGVEPNRIDILMGIAAVDFAGAWERRVAGRYGDCPIQLISRQDLIANKKAVGRRQDLADAAWLEQET